MGEVRIRLGVASDAAALARLCEALWPDAPAAEHARSIAPALAGTPVGILPEVIFVAEAGGAELVGFVNATLRSHADGCDPARPVVYIEGWYVADSHRRQGIGAKLIAAVEEWARAHGCVEMASDTWIVNDAGQRAHEGLGFEEVDRCVHYRKALSPPEGG
ncbi:MAG: GNAT family N-acetyltransferase [Bryobacteraceae bacterium]|nr:GNAT family N-acetyltransferase [Bryobacteraceae bacterium]